MFNNINLFIHPVVIPFRICILITIHMNKYVKIFVTGGIFHGVYLIKYFCLESDLLLEFLLIL